MIKTKRIKKRRFDKIRSFLSLNLISPTCFLGGGSLRTLIDDTDKVEDYDLFFLGDEKKVIKEKDTLEEKIIALGGEKTFQCKEDKLRTFMINDMKIQFICLEYGYTKIEDILSVFDVNASLFGYDGTYLYFNPSSVRDIKRKHISLNVVTYPIGTMKRIVKFHEKGYKYTIATMDYIHQVASNHQHMDLETIYID